MAPRRRGRLFVFDGDRIGLLSVPRLPAVLTAVGVTDEEPGAPCLGPLRVCKGSRGGLEERRARSPASGYDGNAQEFVCLLGDWNPAAGSSTALILIPRSQQGGC